jgi:NAD(P)-dependent dehydrogenase (short-subunit alcohol dehydrogenase family)
LCGCKRKDLLIETENLSRQSLLGQLVVITGAGRGIGSEAARSLVWLGAKGIIVEINKNTGREVEKKLTSEF